MTKDEAYNAATLTELGNNPTGTRMLVVYRAMDLYAKQQAIKFANWITDSSYIETNIDQWVDYAQNRSAITTEELYTLFLSTNQ